MADATKKTLTLPSNLQTEITNGNVVLLFGAGASLTAKKGGAKWMPSTAKLTELIADRFLDEDARKLSLDLCAEYAIAESDLLTVQNFIASELSGFTPTSAHLVVPKLSWKGLATTNYDCLVEDAYQAVGHEARQKVTPSHKNGQPIARGYLDAVPLLKLHGCITRADDPDIPFILTPDQYVKYLSNRENLFRRLMDWGAESTIVFVGHSGNDPNIRAVLEQLCGELKSRKKFYLVKPNPKSYEKVSWAKKNVEVLDATFDDFAQESLRLSGPFQGLGNVVSSAEAIGQIPNDEYERYSSGTKLFLEHEADYVNYMKPPEKIAPKLFFKGGGDRWQGTYFDYDAKRNLTETLLKEEVVERADSDGVFLTLVKSHAGAGKTIVLERTAIELAKDFDEPTFFIRETGELNSRAVIDICNKLNRRVFVFVDDASRFATAIYNLIKAAQESSSKVTIFAEARTNEWNALDHRIKGVTTSEYPLRYLSEDEIRRIIDRLSELGCLFDLENTSPQEKFDAFKERAGRQLLVALHEATQSGNFREIVLDEYRKVTPLLARRLYLTVCVFHRLGILVRAGIINRLYEVPFEEFSGRFLGPLELVVRAQYDKRVCDHVYRARHRDIADFVFRGALTNVEDRLEFYIGAIKYLNLDYKTDSDAFALLISARAIGEFFANPTHGEDIYREAVDVSPVKTHVFHQRGIYRMNCEDPNLVGAKEDLKAANELKPGDFRIIHSLAELELRLAHEATAKLQIEKHIANARGYCDSILGGPNSGYARSTKIKASLLELQTLAREKIDDRDLELLLETLQGDIDDLKKRQPDNATALQTEAKVALWLNETEDAKVALLKAFDKNPRRRFISKSLIDLAKKNGDTEQAMDYAKKVLEAKPEDASANYQYGKLGVEFDCLKPETLEYHFSKAYLDGDSNFDARLLHARTLFLMGKFSESGKIFKSLSREPIPFSQKIHTSYPVSTPRDGRVVQIEATHAWIEDFANGRRVYAHHSKFDEEAWDLLQTDEPVVFTLAFSYMGSCALEIRQRI